MNVFLDIETIPTDNEDMIRDIAAGISAPGNYSKPESIAKWEAEVKPGLVKAEVGRTAFDGTYGAICAIGYAFDMGAPSCLDQCADRSREGMMIDAFLRAVEQKAGMDDVIVIGHNVGWDLRFLWQRAIVNRVRVGNKIKWQSKPWDISVRDTMTMWNPERDRKIKLDTLCKVLGVPTPKGDMDGSKVYEYYQAKRMAEIGLYCCGDVAAMRECYLRMSGDVSMVRA